MATISLSTMLSSIIKSNFPNGSVSQQKKIVYSPILTKFGMEVGLRTLTSGKILISGSEIVRPWSIDLLVLNFFSSNL